MPLSWPGKEIAWQSLSLTVRSGGLSYGDGPGDVQPGISTFAYIEHVRAERGRSWHAVPIIVPRSDGGYRLCSPCRRDKNVIVVLKYEEVGGDIVVFPIVQIQYVFLRRGMQGYFELGTTAGGSVRSRFCGVV